MHLLKRTALAVCLLASTVCEAAGTWSSCQTVVAVDNELADDSGLVAYLKPGITGCGNSTYSYLLFINGQEGVSSTNINSYLAVLLAAQSSGQQVAIYYDSSCFGIEVSIGGNSSSGYCP